MPRTKEFLVTLENRPGAVGEVARAFATAGVSIVGINLHPAGSHGVVHVVASDPARAEQVLLQKGYRYAAEDVLSVRLPHRPGALADLAEKLGKAGVNVDGIWGYAPGGAEGEMIIKASDLAAAEKIVGR